MNKDTGRKPPPDDDDLSKDVKKKRNDNVAREPGRHQEKRPGKGQPREPVSGQEKPSDHKPYRKPDPKTAPSDRGPRKQGK